MFMQNRVYQTQTGLPLVIIAIFRACVSYLKPHAAFGRKFEEMADCVSIKALFGFLLV